MFFQYFQNLLPIRILHWNNLQIWLGHFSFSDFKFHRGWLSAAILSQVLTKHFLENNFNFYYFDKWAHNFWHLRVKNPMALEWVFWYDSARSVWRESSFLKLSFWTHRLHIKFGSFEGSFQSKTPMNEFFHFLNDFHTYLNTKRVSWFLLKQNRRLLINLANLICLTNIDSFNSNLTLYSYLSGKYYCSWHERKNLSLKWFFFYQVQWWRGPDLWISQHQTILFIYLFIHIKVSLIFL